VCWTLGDHNRDATKHCQADDRVYGLRTALSTLFADGTEILTGRALEHITKGGKKSAGALIARLYRSVLPIPTVATLTKFEDPEGNVVGAMRYEATPRT
jgi:hypothetical protein